MRRRFLFLFFLSACIAGIHSQNKIDSLTSVLQQQTEQKDQLQTLRDITISMSESDHPELFNYFKQTLSTAKEVKDEDMFVKMLEYGFYHIQRGKTGISLDFLSDYVKDHLENAKSQIKKRTIGDLHFLYGKTLFYLQKPIDDATAELEKSMQIYRELELQDSFKYGQIAYVTSAIFLEKGDMVKSLECTREAIRIFEIFNSPYIYSAKAIEADLLSSISLFSEAKEVRDETYEKALKDKRYFAIANLKYNQVSDYILQGQEDQIIECLLSGIPDAQQLEENYPSMASVLYKMLTAYYAKAGNRKEAEKYMKKVKEMPHAKMKDENYFFAKSNYHYLKKEWDSAIFYAKENLEYLKDRDPNHYVYEARDLLSVIYQQKAEYKKAIYQKEMALKLKDSININSGTKKAAYYKSMYEIEKKESEIKRLKNEAIIAESNKKLLLLVLFLIVLCSVSIVYFVRQKAKAKQTKLALQIEQNEKELSEFVEQLILKSNEQKSLEDQLEQLRSKNVEQESVDVIKDLADSKILTKDDWYQFKEKFAKVHPDLFVKIIEDGYRLTQSEERLVALEKLGLDNYEISRMLGVSKKTVLMSRYRLRKKLNVSKDTPLIEYFEQVHLKESMS